MSSLAVSFENKNRIPVEETVSVTETKEKPAYRTEILIGGIEVIEKIRAEWVSLCEEGASNQPFLRPEWFAAFVKNFEKEILLITVRRGDNLRAVLPLVQKNGNLHGIPVKKLQAVFNLNTPRFDLIHGAEDETEKEEIIKAVWNEIKNSGKWQVLELRLVKNDSWINDLLAVAESENYLTGIWRMDGAPFVTLPQQGDDKEKLFEAYYGKLKKSFRQDLKRRLTRLKEQGNVEFVTTGGYQAELMRKYFDLEARSWKGRSGTAISCDPRAVSLHEDFARAIAAENELLIYELKLDGKTIAMSINIMYDRKTIFWKTSFDEEYRRFSPGHLLIKEFLADTVRKGSFELDMLCPSTDYKKIWASGEREHAAFYIFQKGILGSLLWKWKFSVINRLRKFKKKTPETSAK